MVFNSFRNAARGGCYAREGGVKGFCWGRDLFEFEEDSTVNAVGIFGGEIWEDAAPRKVGAGQLKLYAALLGFLGDWALRIDIFFRGEATYQQIDVGSGEFNFHDGVAHNDTRVFKGVRSYVDCEGRLCSRILGFTPLALIDILTQR